MENDQQRLEDELAEAHKQMKAVWDYVQKVSPWSPSNDMPWSDEVICGVSLLERELAEAQKDAARYRWLREFQEDMCIFITMSPPRDEHLILFEEDADAAIDAAIAAGEGK